MARQRGPAKALKGGKRIQVAGLTMFGYAVIIGNIWKTRVGNGSYISTNFCRADGVKGEDEVRKILKARIEAYRAGAPITRNKVKVAPVVVDGEIGYVAELAEEYKKAVLERENGVITKRGRKKESALMAAIAHYLPKGDTALNAATIRRLVIECNRTSTLTSGTRQGYMVQLSAMFAYAVRAEYMTTNPLDALEMPKNNGPKIEGFTTAEITSLISYCDKHGQHQVAQAIRLQSLLGCRVDELLTIPRSRITDSELWLHGKGDKWRRFTMVILPELKRAAKLETGDGTARLRLEWLEAVRSLVGELMGQPAPVTGYLIGLKYNDLYLPIDAAKKALRFPEDKRSTHSIRKYALWYWREVLRLPPDIRHTLAAHKEEVAGRYYESQRSATEQARAILLD